jgi:hypothetical protein
MISLILETNKQYLDCIKKQFQYKYKLALIAVKSFLRLLADEKMQRYEIAQKNEKNNLLPALLLLSC